MEQGFTRSFSVKDACPECGEVLRVTLERKKARILCFYVKCGNCGRESAKHIDAQDAIKEWRFNRERKENGQTDGSHTETE